MKKASANTLTSSAPLLITLFPQIIESYWAGNATAEQLAETAKNVRKERWETMKKAGVDIIPR